MTKAAALHSFFSSFDMPAYPRNQVPKDAELPWITYEPRIGNAGDNPIAITADVWYRTESEKIPNDKVEEIANKISDGGITVKYDGGLLWIQRDEPWCIPLNDEYDETIKRRSLNISLLYL